MVEILIRRDAGARVASFRAAGHAGWAHSGDDIVCAAVSTVLQAAWLGLVEVAKIDVRGRRSKGALSLTWSRGARESVAVAAIVDTAALALERIAAQHPDHVRVVEQRGGSTPRLR